MPVMYSLIQSGTDPDHIPVDKHILVSSPHKAYPESQLYITVEPKVVEIIVTPPLLGTPGC